MSLEAVAAEVRAKAKELGMSIIPGSFGDKQPTTYNTYEDEINGTEFVSAAHQAGAKVLLLSVQVVTEADLEDDERDASQLKERRKYLGKVCRVQMFAQFSGSDVFLEWERAAEWASEFFGWDDLEEWDEDDEDPEENTEVWERATQALAQDPKFQLAKNTSQRTRAATAFFKAHPELEPGDGYNDYSLVRDAFDHFEMEIKPAQDDKLAEEAQRLLDSGLNRSQVARQLKITPDRLKKLV